MISRWWANVLNGLFGDPSPRTGEGIEVTFDHTWPWPPWLTLLFLVAVACYVLAIYWHEPGKIGRGKRLALATIRMLLVALLVTMMYGWMRDRYRTDLPDIVVVVDDSESMSVADQYEDRRLMQKLESRLEAVGTEQPTRINLARSLLLRTGAGWLADLRARYNVKLYLLSTTARIQRGEADDLEEVVRETEAVQPASRLGNGLQDILELQRGRPTAAVILLTDGVTTEGKPISEVAHYARRKRIPLFIAGIGDDRPPRDLRLADLLVDDTVFLGDLINFDFKLSGSGFAAENVTVLLRQRGRDEVLAETEVTLSGDGPPQSVRLSTRPAEEGEHEFVVEVVPLKNETNVENNLLSQVVLVRDESLRVLYVQEYPSPEFRFLKTLLERGLKREGQGKAIQLTTVLQEADLEYVDLDETAHRVFPVSRDELFAYDVVIFGDVNPAYMSRLVLENLAAFVKERGGGMVFIAGPRHTPLAYRGTPLEDLLPIDLSSVRMPDEESLIDQSFHVQLTRLGMTSPQLQLVDQPAANLELWRRLPALRWLLYAPDVHIAARALVEQAGADASSGAHRPVVVEQFVGAGRVILHGTDESYLWSRYQGNDAMFERYWIQTIRYLSRSRLLGGSRAVELTTDQRQYYRGEVVPLHVRFFDERTAPVDDEGVVVEVERDRGRRQRIKLRRDLSRRGIFEGTISNLPEGSYRAWMVAPAREDKPAAQNFTVVPPPGERARLVMDAADLQLAAETSQGKLYSMKTADRLPADLPPGRQVRIESLPATPIWNSPLLAGLFVLLLVTEWLLRRRFGWL